MKHWIILSAILLLGYVSCSSNQQTVSNPGPASSPPAVTQAGPVVQAPQPVQGTPVPPPEEVIINEYGITQQEFDAVKFDIQQFVQELNGIIRAQNYNSWLSNLSVEYRNRINSREFLNDIMTRYPVYRGRINSARDYFTLVIVPSRTNDRVDDIAYTSEHNVLAYTLNSEGNRLILYELEHIDGKWLIVQ